MIPAGTLLELKGGLGKFVFEITGVGLKIVIPGGMLWELEGGLLLFKLPVWFGSLTLLVISFSRSCLPAWVPSDQVVSHNLASDAF